MNVKTRELNFTEFKFKPASFGEYKIWCEVDGAKSSEIISTYYCEPTSLSITYSNTGNDFIVSITSDITNVNKSKLLKRIKLCLVM